MADKKPDVRVRMLKDNILRLVPRVGEEGDGNEPILKIPGVDANKRPTEITVREDIAEDWITCGIAELA